ncbi:MAG: alanine--tRNA ligase-related protein, partial [Rikenellaceae bacterium]
FPIDLTELIAKEQGVGVDLVAFEGELQIQKERSRSAAAVETDDWQELIALKNSEFVGYDTLTAPVKIARYRKVTTKNKTSYQLVFDQTPFYGNSGGQVGDTGYITSSEGERCEVVATEKENGLTIQVVEKLPSNLEGVFVAQVDPEKRQSSANNHTATHLLHAALRSILGTHVEQKGSLVTPDHLRFDFSHFQKLTPEELRSVEMAVNRAVRGNDVLCEWRNATMKEAEAAGAMMLFGEKYGDSVRVIRFGESVELCGGTHTSATGNIGYFKIISESAISAGVRRIEATTGAKAESMIYAGIDLMNDVAKYVNNPQILQTIKKMVESNDALSKEVEQMRKEQVEQWSEKLILLAVETSGIRLISGVADRQPDFQRDMAHLLRSKGKDFVYVAGTAFGGKPTLTIMLGDEIVAKGLNAGKIIREAAKLIQGGGGGQPFFASAGGKNVEGLESAVTAATEMILEELK